MKALYGLVFQRAPNAAELKAAVAFVKSQPELQPFRLTQFHRQMEYARKRAKDYTKRYNRPAPAAFFTRVPIPMGPVDKLAQVLLETNEFLYVL